MLDVSLVPGSTVPSTGHNGTGPYRGAFYLSPSSRLFHCSSAKINEIRNILSDYRVRCKNYEVLFCKTIKEA